MIFLAFSGKSHFSKPEKGFTDTEIIQALTKDGAAANRVIEYLYTKVRPLLIGRVIMGYNAEEESWDVFQDGLLILIESIRAKKFQGKSSIKTFLLRICRNCWFQKLRKIYLHQDKIENLSHMEDKSPESVLQYLSEKENREGIQQIFEKLPEKCAEILKLFYWDGFDMSSIANRLGYKDANSVKARKNQCQRFLIQYLKEHPELLDLFYQRP